MVTTGTRQRCAAPTDTGAHGGDTSHETDRSRRVRRRAVPLAGRPRARSCRRARNRWLVRSPRAMRGSGKYSPNASTFSAATSASSSASSRRKGGGSFRTADSAPTTRAPVTGDTVFEIGSVTKVFTALLLADMARRGEVKLTDPVAKYLPASVAARFDNGTRRSRWPTWPPTRPDCPSGRRTFRQREKGRSRWPPTPRPSSFNSCPASRCRTTSARSGGIRTWTRGCWAWRSRVVPAAPMRRCSGRG